jgi:hypothetical protein
MVFQVTDETSSTDRRPVAPNSAVQSSDWTLRGDHAIKHIAGGMLFAAAILATACDAAADGSSIGVGIISDRDPGDFGNPKNTKYELNGAYSFDSGLIFGGSFQYSDTPSAIEPARILKERSAIACRSASGFR